MAASVGEFVEILTAETHIDIERLRAVARHGVPDEIRAEVWKYLLGVEGVDKANELSARQAKHDEYKRYLRPNSDRSSHTQPHFSTSLPGLSDSVLRRVRGEIARYQRSRARQLLVQSSALAQQQQRLSHQLYGHHHHHGHHHHQYHHSHGSAAPVGLNAQINQLMGSSVNSNAASTTNSASATTYRYHRNPKTASSGLHSPPSPSSPILSHSSIGGGAVGVGAHTTIPSISSANGVMASPTPSASSNSSSDNTRDSRPPLNSGGYQSRSGGGGGGSGSGGGGGQDRLLNNLTGTDPGNNNNNNINNNNSNSPLGVPSAAVAAMAAGSGSTLTPLGLTIESIIAAYLFSHPHGAEYGAEMVYLCGPCAALFPLEADAFYAFSAIMSQIENHFTVASFNTRVSDFLMLFRALMPDLHNHFEEEEVNFKEVASSWFRHLLSKELPLDSLFRLWDAYFSMPSTFGLHAFVCLAILTSLKDNLEDLEQSEIHAVLLRLPIMDMDQVINLALSIRDEVIERNLSDLAQEATFR